MSRYENMLSYVPLYYHSSNVFKAILSSEGGELDLLRQSLEGLKAQLFIDTATWGLQFWEKEFGLAGNPELTYEERRSRIKGKIRGIGKVGVELIRSVAEAYSNGEVGVSFDGDVTITFLSTRGIPTALGELQKQLAEVMPAHLTVHYVFTYLTWQEFDLLSAAVQESMTWEHLEIYKP